jgi:hypothetical protein
LWFAVGSLQAGSQSPGVQYVEYQLCLSFPLILDFPGGSFNVAQYEAGIPSIRESSYPYAGVGQIAYPLILISKKNGSIDDECLALFFSKVHGIWGFTAVPGTSVLTLVTVCSTIIPTYGYTWTGSIINHMEYCSPPHNLLYILLSYCSSAFGGVRLISSWPMPT